MSWRKIRSLFGAAGTRLGKSPLKLASSLSLCACLGHPHAPLATGQEGTILRAESRARMGDERRQTDKNTKTKKHPDRR